MKERLRREIALVEREFGEVELGPNLDWFIVRQVSLESGWTKKATQILILLPGGYPTTPPDNFYADPDLRLTSGSVPGNANPDQTAAGRSWLLFSYHVESPDWKPDPVPENGHNLLTFLHGVARRLREAN